MDNKTDIHTLLTRNSSMFRVHYPKNYVTDAESFTRRVTRLPLLAAHIVRAYNSCSFYMSFGRTLFAEYASEMSRALVNAGGASNAI